MKFLVENNEKTNKTYSERKRQQFLQTSCYLVVCVCVLLRTNNLGLKKKEKKILIWIFSTYRLTSTTYSIFIYPSLFSYCIFHHYAYQDFFLLLCDYSVLLLLLGLKSSITVRFCILCWSLLQLLFSFF